MSSSSQPTKNKTKPLQQLLAGGIAGFVESSICHPLDTIKTRMQLRRQTTGLKTVERRLEGRALGSLRDATTATLNASNTSTATRTVGTITGSSAVLHDVGWQTRLPPASTATATPTVPGTVVATLGPFGTARRIVQREGPLALYKGLTAVYTGIIPKMAIRFVSFEWYRDTFHRWHSQYYYSNLSSSLPIAQSVTFAAGLLSGLTEAIVIVTPAEVCKIRMQSQYHSLMDPTHKPQQHAKYKNVVQTAALIVKEEGLGALYKGVLPTMLRQGCNQAVNFTVYNWSKKVVCSWKEREGMVGTLDAWQSLVLGGLSGGMGPLVNNPLDVVKTRMQKQVIQPGKEAKYKSLIQSCIVIAKEEGITSLWKGITPRLMRIMPGQAITFMTYEAVNARMDKLGWFD